MYSEAESGIAQAQPEQKPSGSHTQKEASRASVKPSRNLRTHSCNQAAAQALLATASQYTARRAFLPLKQEALLSRPICHVLQNPQVHRIPERQCSLGPLSYVLAGPMLSKARAQVCSIDSHLTQRGQRTCECP